MSDPLEMAHCVEINIENMVRVMPILERHPLLPIVRFQIKECIEALEAAAQSVQATMLDDGDGQIFKMPEPEVVARGHFVWDDPHSA